MVIEVKKTHIRRGRRLQPDACPIALAIRESLGSEKVQVHKEDVKIGRKTFDLPEEAQWFVDAFDTKKSSVQPFSFEL